MQRLRKLSKKTWGKWVLARPAPVAASASALLKGIPDLNFKLLPGRLGSLTVPNNMRWTSSKRKCNNATVLMLLRSLRARKFDMAKVKEMYISNGRRLKGFGVDEIVKPVVDNHKNDKLRAIERLGLLVPCTATDPERYLKRLRLRSSRAPVETSCTILDLQNDSVMQVSSIGQDRYAECMGKFYIINAPFMFSTVSPSPVGSDYKDKLLAQNLPK
ncbi:hypothetical protein B0H12DRAFT_1209500 [Mycena haematopus]|nr:hypothetical protein B0H12DRAFT_1209500 [Mycena haematopus]